MQDDTTTTPAPADEPATEEAPETSEETPSDE